MTGVTPATATDAQAPPTFTKTVTAARADEEIRGRASVAGHLTTPSLLGRTASGANHTLLYEDVFATGRCRGTLADLIGAADRDPAHLPVLRATVNQVAADLVTCAERGGGTAPLTDCVSALYLDRMRPGGRIDRWYRPGVLLGGIRAATLSGYRLVVNGKQYRLDLADLIATLRAALTHGRWQTSLSQGDPTEPNIAYPVCWLDFEHAGRNSLAGDAAILVWYLLGMGGWLVPTYRSDTYRRTLRESLPPVATPTAHNFEVSVRRRHVCLDYSWTVGPGRQTAIATVRNALAADLGAAITTGDVLEALRPMLAVRILTVISLTEMTAPDAMLCLAKLVEILTGEQGLDQILAVAVAQGGKRT